MKVLAILFFSISMSFAMNDAHEQGKAFANSKNGEVEFASKTSAEKVPGFKQTDGFLNEVPDGTDLEKLSQEKLKTNEAGKSIADNSAKRERYNIDKEKDPLFKEADEITANPLKIIEGEEKEIQLTSDNTIIVYCEDSVPETEKKCIFKHIVKSQTITPAKYETRWRCKGCSKQVPKVIPAKYETRWKCKGCKTTKKSWQTINGSRTETHYRCCGCVELGDHSFTPAQNGMYGWWHIPKENIFSTISYGGFTVRKNGDGVLDLYRHVDDLPVCSNKEPYSKIIPTQTQVQVDVEDTITHSPCDGNCKNRNEYPFELEPAKTIQETVAFNHKDCDGSCTNRENYQFKTADENIENNPERYEISSCDELEKLADEGICYSCSKIVKQGNDSVLQKDGKTLKEEWVLEERTYKCRYSSENSCEALKKKGCKLISSECKQNLGNDCVVWKRKFECSAGKNTGIKTLGGKVPFGLDGKGAATIAQNGDMLEVLAKMRIFQEMQNQAKELQVFSGKDCRCGRHIINFTDCCGSKDGWGISLGLSSCSEGEKQLIELRKQFKCHEIGTYCAERLPLIGCVLKKTTYVCFQSKLARILHEQGRAQLGIEWGSPENPNCSGFTPEQLSKLDFSKLDLHEVYEEILSRMKQPDQNALQNQLKNAIHVPKAGEKTSPVKEGIKNL